jgi:hypothetical protein
LSVSFREAVLVAGVLKGMDLEAHCVVRAVKVSLPKLDTWEYVAADVVQAPNDLPTGAYEVVFEGRKVKVHKTQRGWTSEQE